MTETTTVDIAASYDVVASGAICCSATLCIRGTTSEEVTTTPDCCSCWIRGIEVVLVHLIPSCTPCSYVLFRIVASSKVVWNAPMRLAIVGIFTKFSKFSLRRSIISFKICSLTSVQNSIISW